MQEFGSTISGFYYDQQKNNPLLTLRLYPNRVIKNKKWVPPENTDEKEGYLRSSRDNANYYSTEPIATAIMNEDFSVAIANTWSQFGGDPIGSAWNSLKSSAPYTKVLADALSSIGDITKNYDFSHSNWKILQENGNQIGDFFSRIGKQENYLHELQGRSLIVQGTQFSHYGGTGVDFGSLGLKFTIFADYFNGEWKSVYRQLTGMEGNTRKETGLIDYAIGDYVPLFDDTTKNALDGWEPGSETKAFLNEFAQWQKPPGDFEAALKNVDTIQKGTLKLEIGPYFAVTNLVIQNLQLNFSKTMIKNPEKWNNGECVIEPMSCDVLLALKPASMSSKNSMLAFIGGDLQKKKRGKLEKIIKDSLFGDGGNTYEKSIAEADEDNAAKLEEESSKWNDKFNTKFEEDMKKLFTPNN
jgi:hypothetical protein